MFQQTVYQQKALSFGWDLSLLLTAGEQPAFPQESVCHH